MVAHAPDLAQRRFADADIACYLLHLNSMRICLASVQLLGPFGLFSLMLIFTLCRLQATTLPDWQGSLAIDAQASDTHYAQLALLFSGPFLLASSTLLFSTSSWHDSPVVYAVLAAVLFLSSGLDNFHACDNPLFYCTHALTYQPRSIMLSHLIQQVWQKHAHPYSAFFLYLAYVTYATSLVRVGLHNLGVEELLARLFLCTLGAFASTPPSDLSICELCYVEFASAKTQVCGGVCPCGDPGRMVQNLPNTMFSFIHLEGMSIFFGCKPFLLLRCFGGVAPRSDPGRMVLNLSFAELYYCILICVNSRKVSFDAWYCAALILLPACGNPHCNDFVEDHVSLRSWLASLTLVSLTKRRLKCTYCDTLRSYCVGGVCPCGDPDRMVQHLPNTTISFA